ncbi:MAG: DUF3631 domain-containing protein [Thiotrichales bacterium]
MSIADDLKGASVPEETDAQAIARLAALSPLEYDRVREDEAKKLGARVATLDKQVFSTRKDSDAGSAQDELVQGVEPWPDAVNGVDLVAEMRETFNRYCVLPAGGDVALSLWSLAGYSINQFRIFPKACLSSPEKRCGKTTTLEVIGAVSHRAMTASNLSPSMLFRAIDAWQPSLLIDEADTFIHSSDELRGVINSGHTRSGAYVLRTEGDSSSREPVKFSTWAPMCIAMIKTPPDTIRDRSIMVILRRKMPGESVAKLPFDLAEDCRELRQKCKRWSDDHAAVLRASDPAVPQLTNERAMDNWLPLLAVADAIGGEWPELARNAMLMIENAEDSDDDGIGPMILADIRTIFDERGSERIFSDDLVEALVDMEERPWCEWKHGKPMTKTSLARMLKPFGISSRDIRYGKTVKRGYRLPDFEDAFSRYLHTPPSQSATTLQVNNGAACSGFQNTTTGDCVAVQKTLQPNNDGGCSDVALQKGSTETASMDQEGKLWV